ncbi:hypothetical protein BDN67DRAFT_1005629 [Paxillus ammoniavirescens]|nr:hypothetical protein BDN67DRAFT_1005629 [Paxillus ammoniavirescens]
MDRKIHTLSESNQMLTAQLDASNAHCTLAQRALTQSRIELENVKKKKNPRPSEDFEKAEVERHEKEKAEAEKQAKRKADGEVRVAQIERDIRDKVFDAPLSSFRRKDEYITLAGALGISQDGTVEELKTRIKNYVADPTQLTSPITPAFLAYSLL